MDPIMDSLITGSLVTQYPALIQQVKARLAARTVKGPSCWEIQGTAVHGGYVHIGISVNGRQKLHKAHRVAWELENGPIPEGMRVMHACDNPRCVNPKHLSLGTQAQNIHDSIRKGRYNTFGVQKLDAVNVHAIRALWAGGALQKTIAAQFGITRQTVSGIVRGHSWAHLPDQGLQASQPQSVEPSRAFDLPHSPFQLVPSRHVAIVGEVR